MHGGAWRISRCCYADCVCLLLCLPLLLLPLICSRLWQPASRPPLPPCRRRRWPRASSTSPASAFEATSARTATTLPAWRPRTLPPPLPLPPLPVAQALLPQLLLPVALALLPPLPVRRLRMICPRASKPSSRRSRRPRKPERLGIILLWRLCARSWRDCKKRRTSSLSSRQVSRLAVTWLAALAPGLSVLTRTLVSSPFVVPLLLSQPQSSLRPVSSSSGQSAACRTGCFRCDPLCQLSLICVCVCVCVCIVYVVSWRSPASLP
jgi:hypothetical protein